MLYMTLFSGVFFVGDNQFRTHKLCPHDTYECIDHFNCWAQCRMKSSIAIVIVLSISAASGLGLAAGDDGCPRPWTYHHNSSCECGATLQQKVKCNTSTFELRLQYCLCMTYDNKTSETVVGYCPYSCIANARKPAEVVLRVEKKELDNVMCGAWNRRGQMCSQCMPGYGVPLYSYDFHCVKCKEYQIKEVFRYLAVAFLPLTLMCIIITLFHINILHPPWSVFVLVCQVLSAPPVMQGVYSYTKRKAHSLTYVSIFATVLGPWNLDFFRALYKPICISPYVSNLQSAAIDGSIGLYPLVLLSLLYIQLKLHDRGCRVVTTLWKPFHFCVSRFRQSLDIRSSLIDTFATFFLLSYMKTGFAAFYILIPTRVWSSNGSHKMFLYYDPSVQYFQDHHITYGIVTLLLSLIIHTLPLILLSLYPFCWFQRCLHQLHLRSLALDAFVDAFQGCYKDGTNGTRDCRYFASLNILLRASMVYIYGFTKDPKCFLHIWAVVIGIYITLFVMAQPYKNTAYNRADSLVMMVLLLITVSALVNIVSKDYLYLLRIWRVAFSFGILCLLLYVIYWIFVYIRGVVRRHCRQIPYRRTVLLQ